MRFVQRLLAEGAGRLVGFLQQFDLLFQIVHLGPQLLVLRLERCRLLGQRGQFLALRFPLLLLLFQFRQHRLCFGQRYFLRLARLHAGPQIVNLGLHSPQFFRQSALCLADGLIQMATLLHEWPLRSQLTIPVLDRFLRCQQFCVLRLDFLLLRQCLLATGHLRLCGTQLFSDLRQFPFPLRQPPLQLLQLLLLMQKRLLGHLQLFSLRLRIAQLLAQLGRCRLSFL